jgi:hypothetical protein
MTDVWHFGRLPAIALGIALAAGLGIAPPAEARPRLNVLDAGILERSPLSPNILETVVPAVVRIETDRPVQVEVLSAHLSDGPDRDPSGTEHVIIVRSGSQRVNTQSGDRTLTIPAGITDLEVTIQVERPRQFSYGNYQYRLTLALID